MKTMLTSVCLAVTCITTVALAQSAGSVTKNVGSPATEVTVVPPDALLAEQRARLAANEDQLRQAERVLATSQKAIQLAQAKSGDLAKARVHLARVVHRHNEAVRTLVIPKDAGDAKNVADVEQDLSIMAHILSKAANNDTKAGRAMGISVFGWTAGEAAPQNLYVEGYGALFFLTVNYPLLPPPDKTSEAGATEKKDSEWEQARREMTGSLRGGDDFSTGYGSYYHPIVEQYAWEGNEGSPYDAARVEDLKRDLVSALKNAANIRKLKGDEVVTVVVTGTSASSGGKTVRSTGVSGGEDLDAYAADIAADHSDAGTPAKMILRVRKSDADAFQNGKLNLDDFRKKVTTMLY